MAMNRIYELMFIVRPDMADEDLDKLVSNLESTVTSAAGTVKSVDRMGKRRLAYAVRKFREGIYILMTIEGAGTVIHELERRLRVTEQVIKFLTVRVDEEQKRLDKIKKLARREEEGKRAAGAVAEEAPAAPPRRKLRRRRSVPVPVPSGQRGCRSPEDDVGLLSNWVLATDIEGAL
jgi:small subunit ribosomal protein S6